MKCPIASQRTLYQTLGKLPKGSACQDWKDVPARSGYWRDETDSVTRCAKWDTSGRGRSRPPSKDGGSGGSDSDSTDDNGSVFDEYRDIKIMRGTVHEEFDAILELSTIQDLRDAFEDCRTLAGSTFKQVRENSDIQSVGMKQLFGTTSADADTTIAHAQQMRDLGPFGEDIEPTDAPERVNGWELRREESDKIDYTADWYEDLPAGNLLDTEPHEVDEAMVTVTYTGSNKFPKRWTTSINVWSEDDKNVYNTDLEHKLGDNNTENRNDALEFAIEWIEDHPAADPPEPPEPEGEEEDDPTEGDFPEFDIQIDNGRLREVTEPFKRFPRKTGGAHFTVDADGAIDFIGMDAGNIVMYETHLLLSKADSATVENAGETVGFDSHGFAQSVADVNMSEDASLSAKDGKLVYEATGKTSTFDLEASTQGMPSFPSIDIGVTAGPVGVKRFKNRIKGLSKVNDDSIALVFEDREFYMVTENKAGDRARAQVIDNPDRVSLPSDGLDRYASLFGYEFLKDVAMSPYAPGSTDLRFGLYQLDHEENDESRYYTAPLQVSYEQRGGFVKYTIAPRMVTDKANKNAEEWDLSSPPCPVQSVDSGIVLGEPLESGDEVPDVEGMDLHEGDSIVWTFPKAEGCRCGSQAIQYEQLAEELGVPVYGIAAVEAGDLHEMAERYDLSSITLISDPGGQIAAEFGVELEDGKLERRTMFVRDGRITDVSDGVAPPELSQPDTAGCPVEHVSAPLLLAQKNESTLYESIEHPSVYVITGRRGSGKSALAHRLGEKMAAKEDIVPVAVGVPTHVREKYPSEWIHVDELDSAPGDSVVVIDEAYLKFHARQSMKKGNLKMGAYVNTSRHCDRTIVFVSQNSGHLDKMAVSEADGLLIKEPGTFHMEFERTQLRDITERAKNSYDQLPGNLDNREYVYAVSDNFEGLVENDKPEWYDDEVSKSYGAACQPAEPEPEPADD